MATAMRWSCADRRRGMGLIEVLVASMVVTIGLLTIAMTMAQGISFLSLGQEQLIAKQKARETLESIFTARNTQNIQFTEIQNVAAGGIILNGFQPLKRFGNDGIANTADDANDAYERITAPGPDNNLGTADDVVRILGEYQRQVAISTVLLANGGVDPDVRQIEVTIRYRYKTYIRTVSITSLISRFS